MSAGDVETLFEALDRAVRDGFAASRLAAGVLGDEPARRVFRAALKLAEVLGDLSRAIGEGELD